MFHAHHARLLPAALARHRERGQSLVEFALILPIVLIMVMAIVDFARLYTTMLTVESGAREAADYGAFNWINWDPANSAGTVTEMERRACIAVSNLPDFDGSGGTCSNPSFDYDLIPTASNPDCTIKPDPAGDPCRVKVTLTYEFHLFAPIAIDFFGTRLGLPNTLGFSRDSTFAISDFGIDAP